MQIKKKLIFRVVIFLSILYSHGSIANQLCESSLLALRDLKIKTLQSTDRAAFLLLNKTFQDKLSELSKQTGISEETILNYLSKLPSVHAQEIYEKKLNLELLERIKREKAIQFFSKYSLAEDSKQKAKVWFEELKQNPGISIQDFIYQKTQQFNDMQITTGPPIVTVRDIIPVGLRKRGVALRTTVALLLFAPEWADSSNQRIVDKIKNVDISSFNIDENKRISPLFNAIFYCTASYGLYDAALAIIVLGDLDPNPEVPLSSFSVNLSLLHDFMRSGAPESFIKELFNLGADPTTLNLEGNNLLFNLRYNHTEQFAQELINVYGLSVNHKNSLGQTPIFHVPALTGKWMVEFLIKNGANINEQDNNGDTALHYAVNKNEEALTKLLIKFKANPNTINNKGETPHLLAAKQKNETLQKILKK